MLMLGRNGIDKLSAEINECKLKEKDIIQVEHIRMRIYIYTHCTLK